MSTIFNPSFKINDEEAYRKEIESLKAELLSQKIDRLKDRMKNQTKHRIQYAELYRAFAESMNEIDSLKAELCDRDQKKKRKKRNLSLMKVDATYDPPDYWNALE
jgi:hypothetical protein